MKTVFLVCVAVGKSGPFVPCTWYPTREAADAAALRLAEDGHGPFAVVPVEEGFTPG